MTNFKNLLPRGLAVDFRYFRQDRIADSLESLRDQCRADDTGRVPGAESDHPPAPALRHGQRKEITHQVDDVLKIVVEANALRRISANSCTVFFVKLCGPANSGVEACVFGKRCGNDALADVCFNQDKWFTIGCD